MEFQFSHFADLKFCLNDESETYGMHLDQPLQLARRNHNSQHRFTPQRFLRLFLLQRQPTSLVFWAICY